MTYQHLCQDERYQIYALLKAGHAISRIAEIIGRHKSTISLELARNVRLKGYRPQQAQRFAELKGRNSRNAPLYRRIRMVAGECVAHEQMEPRASRFTGLHKPRYDLPQNLRVQTFGWIRLATSALPKEAS
jgi:IS30 family transposase